MATVVIDLQDKRPIWALPDWAREQITSALPDGWSVLFIEAPSDGSGDGAGRASPEVLEAVKDARVYMGYGIPAEVLVQGSNLEWVHSGAAGVGSSLTPEMLASPVRFTNSAGIHADPIAEMALAMMLYFARGVDLAVHAQREGRWGAKDFWAADAPLTELGGSQVGILGYGGIGRAIGDRVQALGANVVGIRRRAGGETAKSASLRVVGFDALDSVLAESDFMVLSVPETDQTRGIMTRDRLLGMKQGAVLINVGRGKLVDSDGVLDALDQGPLRGAGLDVFHTEPLPEGHPFYAHPQVLVTPHVSATTRRFWERETELICENLGRLTNGGVLRNQVDKLAGY
ncbi:MAG: D-2-hydroxyacid dehydrogenase [Longimicrobiales bacterium]